MSITVTVDLQAIIVIQNPIQGHDSIKAKDHGRFSVQFQTKSLELFSDGDYRFR